MLVHFLLIVSGILTVRTRNKCFSASLSMSRSIRSPLTLTTVLTFESLVSAKGRNYLKTNCDFRNGPRLKIGNLFFFSFFIKVFNLLGICE